MPPDPTLREYFEAIEAERWRSHERHHADLAKALGIAAAASAANRAQLLAVLSLAIAGGALAVTLFR